MKKYKIELKVCNFGSKWIDGFSALILKTDSLQDQAIINKCIKKYIDVENMDAGFSAGYVLKIRINDTSSSLSDTFFNKIETLSEPILLENIKKENYKINIQNINKAIDDISQRIGKLTKEDAIKIKKIMNDKINKRN